METVLDVIEFNSQEFISLWLTQKSFEKWKDTEFKELPYILQKPHVLLYRNSKNAEILDTKFLVNGTHKGQHRAAEIKQHTGKKYMERPFAIVILLNPSGQHSNCRLSKNDVNLLDSIVDFVRRVENVTYILAGSRHSVKYDVTDLESISRELQGRLYKDNTTNKIFSRLYFQNDSEIRLHIGLCLNSSIFDYVKNMCDNSEIQKLEISSELDCLVRKRNRHISLLRRKLSRRVDESSKCDLVKIEQDVAETSSEYLSKIVKKWDLIKTHKEQKDTLSKILQEQFQIRLKGTVLPKRIPVKRSSRLARKTRTYPRYNTRSHLKVLQMSSETANGLMNKVITKSLVEGIYAQFLQIMTGHVNNNCEKLAALTKMVYEKYDQGKKNMVLHELKTVSERCTEVKGFGFVDKTIYIYLKEDSEIQKTNVYDFIKQYIDLEATQIPVKVEYKKRKITLFSRLEQGSKIHKSNGSAGEQIRYGTLGLFLEDKNGRYFFTTCAHVIGNEAFAYSSHDNSVLGKNVLILDSNTDGVTVPCIDFSLVHVSPDKSLTCIFGLKTRSGEFIKGQIFRGQISEILNCNIYKWGATQPHLRRGKCIGYIIEDNFLLLQVDNEAFAQEGDSGSIVCIGDDIDPCLAAFVIVGGSSDYDNQQRKYYLVYKISDALDKIAETKGEMTPCLDPSTRVISISSATSNHPKRSPKRKSETKVLEPRTKQK